MGLEKVRLSGWEALADVRLWFQNRRVGRVSLVERGLEKIRLSGRECSRRRPSGDRCFAESDSFRQKGKFRWSEGLAVNRQCGWVGLAVPAGWKRKFVCPGGSRRRPTMVSESPCRTGKPRRAGGLKR